MKPQARLAASENKQHRPDAGSLRSGAARACERVGLTGSRSRAPEILKREKTAQVVRVTVEGAALGSVIAKRAREEDNALEERIYSVLLPEVSLESLEVFGHVPDEVQGFSWLILEDAGSRRIDPSDGSHRRMLGSWTSQLHSLSPTHRDLPRRELSHYSDMVKTISGRLDSWREQPLDPEHVRILDELTSRLDDVLDLWPAIERGCEALGDSFVHGDIQCKNVHVRLRHGRPALAVFDWAASGRGIPAVDIAQLASLMGPDGVDAYLGNGSNAELSIEDLGPVTWAGSVLWNLQALEWSSWVTSPALAAEPLNLMGIYSARLDALSTDRYRGPHGSVLGDRGSSLR